jgi:hypothetical protein
MPLCSIQSVRLKREPIAQITAPRDNAADQRALAVGFHQRSDQIELVKSHELENFTSNFALRIARKRIDDLQMLRRGAAQKGVQLTVVAAALDKGVEAGA